MRSNKNPNTVLSSAKLFSCWKAHRECEYEETNGFIFTTKNSQYFIPNEVLTHILSYVDPVNLRRNCVLVCQNWNNLIKYNVWKVLSERKSNKRLGKFPWKAYQNLCLSNAFDKNLIKNPSGDHGMNYWNEIRLQLTGHYEGGWIVEQTPRECEYLPGEEFGEITNCYATLNTSCPKYQTVNLIEEGISPEVMDLMQPKIYVCEWVGSRFQCGCVYELLVTLLNSKKDVLKRFNYRFREGRFQGGTWRKVEHTFENYGTGVRYICFFHGGQATKFIGMHYRSQMTNAIVKILFDFSKINEKSENEECDNEILVVMENIPEYDDTIRHISYPSYFLNRLELNFPRDLP